MMVSFNYLLTILTIKSVSSSGLTSTCILTKSSASPVTWNFTKLSNTNPFTQTILTGHPVETTDPLHLRPLSTSAFEEQDYLVLNFA